MLCLQKGRQKPAKPPGRPPQHLNLLDSVKFLPRARVPGQTLPHSEFGGALPPCSLNTCHCKELLFENKKDFKVYAVRSTWKNLVANFNLLRMLIEEGTRRSDRC